MFGHIVNEQLREGQISEDRLAALREHQHQRDLDELRSDYRNHVNSWESGVADKHEVDDSDGDDSANDDKDGKMTSQTMMKLVDRCMRGKRNGRLPIGLSFLQGCAIWRSARSLHVT